MQLVSVDKEYFIMKLQEVIYDLQHDQNDSKATLLELIQHLQIAQAANQRKFPNISVRKS